MVDSQAQISIIKINQIQIDQVNKQEIVRITGVTPGIIRTEGSVIMQLNFVLCSGIKQHGFSIQGATLF